MTVFIMKFQPHNVPRDYSICADAKDWSPRAQWHGSQSAQFVSMFWLFGAV